MIELLNHMKKGLEREEQTILKKSNQEAQSCENGILFEFKGNIEKEREQNTKTVSLDKVRLIAWKPGSASSQHLLHSLKTPPQPTLIKLAIN